MNNETPQFIVRYWINERKGFGPPTLKHAVFYSEDVMVNELRKIQGNYFIYLVGKPYLTKEHFDKMFAEERLEKERQDYLKLKAKFDSKAD